LFFYILGCGRCNFIVLDGKLTIEDKNKVALVCHEDPKIIIFSLNVFGGTEVPIVYILLCHPSEDSLQQSATSDGSPSKAWQSTVGWGDCWIRTQTAVSQSGVATNEPPLLP
jgi:hypothetical protein